MDQHRGKAFSVMTQDLSGHRPGRVERLAAHLSPADQQHRTNRAYAPPEADGAKFAEVRGNPCSTGLLYWI